MDFVANRYRLHLEPGPVMDASTALRELFVRIGELYDQFADQLQVPPVDVHVVVTDDFHQEVDRTLAMCEVNGAPDEPAAPYDSEVISATIA